MDQNARRRIDNARDVLVGKIPDPKAQVEQITTALIYKFMDDMDKDAQGLGGKPTFFTNGYEKYAWSHILDPRLGGQERLDRYAEALATMSQNPHLPQLFRTIFKDAFLPYRDPTTLNLFLKEIDGFTYDHSENLGDAYEYLLSVLGSQGDAGQFRTPRHIIDFMVRVVDPKKNETMLDPASGTAGFLISSYRHIIEQNHGHQLTPDEKERLAGNLQGYDIAPDMVRIGLVNMYLHSFPNPHIYEYDTLTSEDRWDEQFDICMANPPFMTPKGGIRPHKKFQIQANRSEVLFVDYIAEHLKSTGRAAVIVPEGIIFTSDNAYKKLRKMLVETWGLWAVVSLPAGLFQPYSGVKTSILFLDRVFAKNTNQVLFVKVQNDGFDLGAQRRPCGKNDLPVVQEVLQAWHHGVKEQVSVANWVGRGTIAETGDYNLAGDRYREAVTINSMWPIVQLGQLAEIRKGTPITSKELVPGPVPVVAGGQQPAYYHNCSNRAGETITVSASGANAGFVNFFNIPIFASDCNTIKSLDENKVLTKYLLHVLKAKQDTIFGYQRGGGQPHVYASDLMKFEFPLPSLDVQRQVVDELDGYDRIIDGAKQVVAGWKPVVVVDPSWPMVAVGDVVEFVSGLTVSIPEVECEGGTPIIAINNITEDGTLTLNGLRWIRPPAKTLNYAQKGDLLFNWRNGSTRLVGKTAIFSLDGQYLFASFLLGIRPHSDRVNSRYLWRTLNIYRREGRYMQFMRQNVNGLFNREELKMVKIPLPPLAAQQAIVAEIGAEQELVDGCRKLIEISEHKIKAKIAELWGSPSAAEIS